MTAMVQTVSEWLRSIRSVGDVAWRFRSILKATSILELTQRYAGSALGPAWIIVFPLCFLLIYLFLYMVVFQVRFPGASGLNYVVYVFTGLVPYLIMMESVTRGLQIIKENIHLIKNVIMPIELIPVRLVLVSFLAQGASTALMVALALLDGELSWRIIFFPFVMVLFAMMLIGAVYAVSSLGVLFNDLTYIVNLLITALMFLSPIAFKPEMVPPGLQLVIYLNPISYPLEAIRWSLLASYEPNYFRLIAFPILAFAAFGWGTGFFRRFKGLMADNV
jgi:lipopolysaccharide transport system permease protein